MPSDEGCAVSEATGARGRAAGEAPAKMAVIFAALRHDDCGGVYEKVWSRGLSIFGFQCSRCRDEIEVDFGRGLVADYEASMAAFRQQLANTPRPTACGEHHYPAERRGDGLCICGAVRFRSDDCPTCGQEWDRVEPVTASEASRASRAPGGEAEGEG